MYTQCQPINRPRDMYIRYDDTRTPRQPSAQCGARFKSKWRYASRLWSTRSSRTRRNSRSTSGSATAPQAACSCCCYGTRVREAPHICGHDARTHAARQADVVPRILAVQTLRRRPPAVHADAAASRALLCLRLRRGSSRDCRGSAVERRRRGRALRPSWWGCCWHPGFVQHAHAPVIVDREGWDGGSVIVVWIKTCKAVGPDLARPPRVSERAAGLMPTADERTCVFDRGPPLCLD